MGLERCTILTAVAVKKCETVTFRYIPEQLSGHFQVQLGNNVRYLPQM